MTAIFFDLFNRVGIIIILAFIISRLKPIKKLLAKENIDVKDKIIASIIFGVYGIIGTYMGVYIYGGLANSRAIGVFVGGLLGGPLVGVLAGLIAGGHRLIIDPNGLTTMACTISTILTGIIAASMSKKYYKSRNKYAIAAIGGAFVEVLQMVLTLLLSRPFSDALKIVETIAIPIIVINALGIVIFVIILDGISKEEERIAAKQAQITLRIAQSCFPYFSKGFNEETAKASSEIMQEIIDFDGIIFTDKENILSCSGRIEFPNEIKKLAKKAMENGDIETLNTVFGSAVIVPLKEKGENFGTLILYKGNEGSITKVDLELALGLANLFSTQIALSKLEHQRQLLDKAELKALQSQINPHFLFNSINTIAFCIESEPDKARDLLLHLGHCFRKNLQQGYEDIDIYHEIDHIKSYLEIEKVRFGKKLKIIFDIPDNLDCTLPPLILQPIVENAIIHGIFEKIEGGTVEIKAIDERDSTILIVEDNGIGMEDGFLDRLFNKESNNDSIGLINVNNRLKNKYGEDYGLKINSKLNKGTCVTMKIPKIREVDLNAKVYSS